VAVSDNGGKKKSFDADLVVQAQLLKTHVFACERWMVFSDIDIMLNTTAGGFVQVDFPKGIRRPNTKNHVNLPLFLNVWRAIQADTNWKSFPWVVKADPSTVFIPQSLSRDCEQASRHAKRRVHGKLQVCTDELPWKLGGLLGLGIQQASGAPDRLPGKTADSQC